MSHREHARRWRETYGGLVNNRWAVWQRDDRRWLAAGLSDGKYFSTHAEAIAWATDQARKEQR